MLVWLCTFISARGVAAVNILGFSVPGARSHQFPVLRVGQELAERGHNFTLLVSSEEALDKQRLGKRAFDGLHMATFQGPEGIGTQEWFVNQPRDVAEVCASGVITRLATVPETLLVMYPHTAQELRRALYMSVTQGLFVTQTGFASTESQRWTSQAFLDTLLQAMRAFQSDQMSVAEHLHADVATIQQLKDSGKQLLRA